MLICFEVFVREQNYSISPTVEASLDKKLLTNTFFLFLAYGEPWSLGYSQM